LLLDLRIENFAIADQLNMQPGSGLNVLTGETGAGKSIIVGALSLVTGGRGDSELIRSNADSCLVEALFDISTNHRLQEILPVLGFEESEQLLLVREMNRSGKNRCRVNGRMCTVSTLAQIGKYLLHIYGQHDQQALFDSDNHLEWLDGFGQDELEENLNRTKELFIQFKQIIAHLQKVQRADKTRTERLDLLQYQLEELAGAQLQPDEDILLKQKRDILANAQRLIERLANAHRILSGDNQQENVLQGLAQVEKLVSEASAWSENLRSVREMVDGSLAQLQEAAFEIRKALDEIRHDPGSLQEVEDRLDLLNRLMRKYSRDLSGLISLKEEIESELEELKELEKDESELSEQLDKIRTRLAEEAERLSSKRQRLAEEFSHAVEEELKQLAMEYARFSVEVNQQPGDSPLALPVGDERYICSEKGLDQVRFCFSANPGEELKPLHKVASGGELSRLMLAVKSILVKGESIGTLVFDEVDAGIGGRTAVSVAEKLRIASGSSQVLVVTHLAQIASMADHHFQVEKISTEVGTQVHLNEMKTENDRIKEIARMLDGSMDEATLMHAATMLQKARKSS
jgi:DNA repair protein RecN (Recombination protein N)